MPNVYCIKLAIFLFYTRYLLGLYCIRYLVYAVWFEYLVKKTEYSLFWYLTKDYFSETAK